VDEEFEAIRDSYNGPTPESILAEREQVSFANSVGLASSLPLFYILIGMFFAAGWHNRLPGMGAALVLLVLTIVLCLWAATRGSRWWLASVLVSVGLVALIVLGTWLGTR
jgi:hypothetical protein